MPFWIFEDMVTRFSPSGGTPHSCLLTWILCQLSKFLPAYLGVPAPCVPVAIELWYFYWVSHKVGACQGVPVQNVFLCLLAGVPALNFFGCLLRCATFKGKTGICAHMNQYTVSPVRWDTYFQANRVEHQKLNQTTAELSFGWVFAVQIGLWQKQ